MITIDLIIKDDKGNICGRQIKEEFDNKYIKDLADCISYAIENSINSLEKDIKSLRKLDDYLV